METSYYSKSDVLTHTPLTPDEESALFKRFYAGDKANMSEDAIAARDAIFLNNLRYAASIALRHSSRRQYQKDVISAANLGLLTALESRRFKPSEGRFTTFATKYILGEICQVFRVACAVSFPAGRLPDWPEDSLDPDVDTMSDCTGFAPEHLDHEILHQALEGLEAKERQIIELIFFGGESVKSASEIIGVSRQWGTELRDRAFVKLRLALGVRQTVENDEVELEQEAA